LKEELDSVTEAPLAAAPLEPSRVTPLEDSSDLLGDPAELRARAKRDGYLFFRGLLDPEPVLKLRRAVFGVLDRHGLRVSDADPLSGKLDLARLNAIPAEDLRTDIGVSQQITFEFQRLPELHRLPHHPALVGFYRSFFGEEVFVHPRHMMRAMTPHREGRMTPVHQDFPFIQGSPETWTCWFPVGDCSLELGPLAVLRGSHRAGYLPWEPGFGERHWFDLGTNLCPDETGWVSAAFSIGDVLTFSCFTVHRAIRPTIRDEIRISMDIRYQRASDAIMEGSFVNHSERPWEEIYEGWSAEDADLQYYWEREQMPLVPFNEALMKPGTRRIC
jgi:phytanoyl-CoA dioxygenase PhyH